MRRLFFLVCSGLVIASLAQSPRLTDAATIEGRIVDADGKPLAHAEVRIWQKLRGPDGRSADRSVEFDGSDVLLTDAEGRFVSPDVLAAGAPTQIVAEAGGMLAGRTGWIRLATDAAAVKVPDIALIGLRLVMGRVLDRRGQPVDGATVFNSGDGDERVEATSKGGGRFFLRGVPKGAVFLFAEKPGYRFSGVRLPADRAEATLLLTSLGEPAEPKPTLPPLLSPDEEYALARAVLDAWLERLAKSGTPEQKIRGFSSLAQINGREALQRLNFLGDVDKSVRDSLRHSAILSIIVHPDRISWDEVRAMIDAGDDDYHKAAELIQAAGEIHADERDEAAQARRLEWLESAAAHARKVADPTRRVRALASAAERMFSLGQVARARQVLAEAENGAKPLLPDYGAQYASLHLALAAAHDDADRAMDWLAKTGIYLKWNGSRVAAALLPDHPQQALDTWKQVAEAMRKDRSRTTGGVEYRSAVDWCYRLTLVDRALAEPIAANADEAIVRIRAKGAIILALNETQPAEARGLLAALVREELPQLPTDDGWLLPQQSAPAIAAWLLPVAERVDPALCDELFWRSLALRLPRSGRDSLNDRADRANIELAKLLSRYDRDVARTLLEPLAANASARGTVAGHAVFLAAVHIDPRWAKSLLDTGADSTSSPGLADRLRFYFVSCLGIPLPDRWNGQSEFSAGFWEPAAKDRPLPP
ncbi:MAG TPA: carboxypeptidase regulatory-like domain-containing protein [Pirellulales bacterium]|nr:carboxypeptidase regulatory-like domain-containing protein [Pirellulales bacterium]